MKLQKKETRLVAKIFGFNKLKKIKMVDKTRYSALVGNTDIKILVDIQANKVWQWNPTNQKLEPQEIKINC